mmetsp:Transcript_24098/g.54493  ORF Transcript_24098/g.54493 Transcript_24098/m.54493 type:complete len:357 (+) Transcript_24098:952-2022(+)
MAGLKNSGLKAEKRRNISSAERALPRRSSKIRVMYSSTRSSFFSYSCIELSHEAAPAPERSRRSAFARKTRPKPSLRWEMQSPSVPASTSDRVTSSLSCCSLNSKISLKRACRASNSKRKVAFFSLRRFATSFSTVRWEVRLAFQSLKRESLCARIRRSSDSPHCITERSRRMPTTLASTTCPSTSSRRTARERSYDECLSLEKCSRQLTVALPRGGSVDADSSSSIGKSRRKDSETPAIFIDRSKVASASAISCSDTLLVRLSTSFVSSMGAESSCSLVSPSFLSKSLQKFISFSTLPAKGLSSKRVWREISCGHSFAALFTCLANSSRCSSLSPMLRETSRKSWSTKEGLYFSR